MIVAASLKIDAIDRLILVGGTSRMPYIQNAVADHSGLVPKMDIDPDKAIAYGAALACVAEMARQGRTSFVYGQAIPTSDKFVRDVTAHAVGCCVLDSRGSKQRLVNALARLIRSQMVIGNLSFAANRAQRHAFGGQIDQALCVRQQTIHCIGVSAKQRRKLAGLDVVGRFTKFQIFGQRNESSANQQMPRSVSPSMQGPNTLG